MAASESFGLGMSGFAGELISRALRGGSLQVREAGRCETGGSLDQLARTSLVVGATVAAVSVLRRAMKPRPGHAPSEKPTYGAFPNRVLVVGGGFAGYMAAKTLCDLTEDRDDVGVLVISRENYFAFWPMVPGLSAARWTSAT